MLESPHTTPSANVLGRLLLMQNVLCNLPDERSIFSFVCQGLADMPGIAAVRHRIVPAEIADPALVRLPLTVGDSSFGELLITVSDPAALAVYSDYLSNFCFMIAVILEERHQRRLNEQNKALLEQRVAERTRQLTEEIAERQQAENALTEEARRKDEFLVMLAHELRNPLAPIRNAVEVMRLAGMNEAVLSRQQTIVARQVGHMTRLIDDLLDAGRITRGTMCMHMARIALSDVVEQAIETTTILSGPRKDDFSCRILDHLHVEGDFTRLVQVVCNILTNALKYSDCGQPIRLTISRDPAPAAAATPQALLTIEDQGVGIAPELLPFIFDLFVQADKSLARTRGGLGIGLTLARRIIELHGGRILASSAGLGQGSTFRLWLPTSPPHETAPH